MNNKEIREKIIKRRNLIGNVLTVILMPILFPLLVINKIGELAEIIADFIQNPFVKLQNKMVENYKKHLTNKK